MLDALIATLIEYLTALKEDSLTSQISHLLAASAPFIAIGAATRYWARKKYSKFLNEIEESKDEIGALKETVGVLTKNAKSLEAELEAFEKAGPKGFLKQMEIEGKGDNYGKQINLSQDFLDDQSEALHRA
jgi:hypothetical protein